MVHINEYISVPLAEEDYGDGDIGYDYDYD